MGRRVRRVATPVLWTGPIRFELLNARGWAAGLAEMSVSVDTLTFRLESRTLAIMLRDSFQAWLSSPAQPYAIDDVVWSTQAGKVWLSIDDRLFYSAPGAAVDVLKARL